MRVQNPSDLGPWNRYQEDQHQSSLLRETKNETFKQQLILPKVPIRKQALPYKTPIKQQQQKQKQKLNIPLKLKPIQIEFGSQQSRQQQSQLPDAKKSRTLSFDQPKNSYYRNFIKSHRYKDFATTKFIENQSSMQSYERQEPKEPHSLKKMSKIDLMAQVMPQINYEQIQARINKSKQQQFSKKRSLMQLLRFLKQSPQINSNINHMNQYNANMRSKELKTDRPPTKLKNESVVRYQQYRNAVNLSMQSQSKYLPYFYVKKSNAINKKK